ncbi:MAG: DivIVA domain-containing protein, partial [Ilumatobacteraceae bacterium]
MTHDDSRRPTTDLTPSDIASASFRYVRRGYDIEEVDQFLAEVAQVVDRALSQATAMEARARAAVARLNDHSGSADKAVGEANAETITRTLLMAQRAADAAVEEARVDAERVRK